MRVIDASGLILGRMASKVAKMLLNGETVYIVNAEKAVISGKRKAVIARRKKKLEIRTLMNVSKAPKRPRMPHLIVKRAVRGMLPIRTPRGRAAYKRLRVFIGVPPELKGARFETIPEASASKLKCKYITVGELAKEIGWKGVV